MLKCKKCLSVGASGQLVAKRSHKDWPEEKGAQVRFVYEGV